MDDQTYDVVIIDDESTVTDIFQQYILWKHKDWKFLTFTNSSILHDALENGRLTAKVWVIDLMMPGKNGVEIAVAVRRQQGNTPILLAYTALEKRTLETQEAYQVGLHHFNHIINKREDFNSILSLIEVWIAKQD
jgi:DNA-binding response OmpR family regulator